MHNQHLGLLSRVSAMVSLAMLLTACASGGAPTPPGAIGDTPPSILESLPPAEAPADETDQNGTTNLADADNAGLPPATSLPNAASTSQPAAQYNAPASRAILTFEPMVGAPSRVARELATALGMRVAQQSLPVVKRTDSKVTHRIKGYFSASKSGSECVVSYVWDIFDTKGKRVNRVTGTQKTKMVSSDPWDSVTGPVLDKVATDTAAKLKTWHASI